MAKKSSATPAAETPAAPKPPGPLSPADALLMARNVEPIQRNHCSEYVPAVLELVAKGYHLGAASELVAMGAALDRDELLRVFAARTGWMF